jgi:lantibiotic biosynthesis protein
VLSPTDPVVGGVDAAARVAEVADVVAHAFAATGDDPSLSRGLVGASWLLAESGAEHHRRTARGLLSRAAALHGARTPNVALFSGVTGLQWTLDALSIVLYEDVPDAEASLDRVLAQLLRADGWRGHHDLVSGLVGIGVYALANPRPGQRGALCSGLLDQLERSAIQPAPDHATWITDPSLLAADAREQFPRGRIDLGLAHGVPGVAAWLADVVIHPEIDPPLQHRAARLLDGAITWILARHEADDHPHGYPYFVEPDGRAVPTPRVRLAWCYGDLGVAWALTKSARARDRADWAEAARRIGARAAARDVMDSGVSDPWLCHGGAGVAHVFGCLARATGNPIFFDAARRWWQHALQLAPESTIRAAPALLEGATGFGLALLAAIRDTPPRWNAFLQL